MSAVSKKMVYICSPLRGDNGDNYDQNIEDAKKHCYTVLMGLGLIPIAPHIYFTQFLDDKSERQREIGMAAGLKLLELCDEVWVVGIDNPSAGMKAEIEFAKRIEIPVRDYFEILGEKLSS